MLNQVIRISEKIIGEHAELKQYDSRIDKLYNLLGVIYRSQGDLGKALTAYDHAYNISNDNKTKSAILINMANIFADQGDFSKAIEYYNNVLSYVDTSGYSFIKDVYHNMGATYYRANKWEMSIKYTLKRIDIIKSQKLDGLGISYYNCALPYRQLGDIKMARQYLNLAREYIEREYGNEHYNMALVHYHFAGLMMDLGLYDEALYYFQKSYGILINTVGSHHLYTSYCLKDMGKLYMLKKEYLKALRYFQNSLISVTPGFNEADIYQNPLPGVQPSLDLIDLLKLKATAFEGLSGETDKIRNLGASLKTLESAVALIEDLRTGYLSETSKLQISLNEAEIFGTGIRISAELYHLTNEIKYLHLAFGYSEQNKYSTLREIRTDDKARSNAGISSTISDKERSLSNQITALRIFIESEGKKEKPDSSLINNSYKHLYDLSLEQEKLIKKLEQDYPGYYRMKYGNKVVTPDELRQYLRKDQALLEYAVQDSLIYIFFARSDTFLLKIQRIDSLFYGKLELFEQILHSDYSFPYQSYKDCAGYLYQQLVLPVADQLENIDQLTIVPDVILSKISFEILLTDPSEMEAFTMYRLEPYLLRKFAIGYSFSSMLLVNSGNHNFPLRKSFIGFAPEYTDSPDSLKNIPAGFKSIKGIAGMFLGKAIIKDKATESRFKRDHDYNIIAFYAHGTEDTSNVSLSRMYFSQEADTLEDSYLNSWEISGLRLNANLISLVTCHSGAGTVYRGEGVMSLGRSFAVSGCPSMIISLWSAASVSSHSIMKDFYLNLIRGMSKTEALQQAKLNYLDEAGSMAIHPRYWSGLIIIGNDEPLFKNFILKVYILPGTGILMIILVLLLRKRLVKAANDLFGLRTI